MKMLLAYKRKMETIATSKMDAARIAATPLIDPFVSSIAWIKLQCDKGEIKGDCKD